MPTLAGQLQHLAAPCLGLARLMLKDVKPSDFARKPAIGGTVVDANHPAFAYGHLATYPAKAMKALGLDPAPAEVPAAYAELFAAGKPCLDDPKGEIYPPMEEITAHFFRSYEALLAAIKDLPDAKLMGPNPGEGRIKEMFPDLAGLMMFFLGSHPMMHLGQVSTWRRCFGLGSVM